jgi:hypothetical protein
MYRARYAPRVLERRALLAVVCHGALRVVRAVYLKSPGPGVRVRRSHYNYKPIANVVKPYALL